jgi:hypothetical protein
MTGFDPTYITTQNWADISNLLATLWMILGSAFGLGGSIMLAHGMFPSLANTRDIPVDMAAKARPLLYAVAAAFLLMALISVYLFASRLDVITSIYYRGAQ